MTYGKYSVCRSILWNTRMYRFYTVRARSTSRHRAVDRIYRPSIRHHTRIFLDRICRADRSLDYITLYKINKRQVYYWIVLTRASHYVHAPCEQSGPVQNLLQMQTPVSRSYVPWSEQRGRHWNTCLFINEQSSPCQPALQ